MMMIRLTLHNMLIAGYIALDRNAMNNKHQVENTYGAERINAEQLGIEGCYGEMAVAKALGIYWDGALGDYKAKDVGPYQVRATRHASGKLILHPRDEDDDIFILVVINKKPLIQIVGWIYASEGKQEKYWADPTRKNRHAFFVPQSDLHDMSTLPKGENHDQAQPERAAISGVQ